MRHTIFALFCTLFLVACGQGEQNTSPAATSQAAPPKAASQNNQATPPKPLKPEHVQAASTHATTKTYKVIAYPYTPFVVRDEKGNMSGFEIEILQEIEKKQNIHFEFTPMLVEWGVLFNALEKKQGDLLSAAMYANPERAQRFDMSEPYLDTQFVFLNGKDINIHGFENLKGKRISVFKGTMAEAELKALPFANEIDIISTNSVYEAVKEVVSGNADAAYSDYVVLSHYAKEFKQHGVGISLNPYAQKHQFVFFIAKGNPELLQHLNEGLTALKADGTLKRLQDKFLAPIY